MIFSVGTKVRLKHTGDIGKITALLADGMVQVYLLADDMEIPVDEEFLERYDVQSTTKAKVVKGKQPKSVEPPPAIILESQYTILKSHGIQLAFDPIYKKDGTTERFDLYLINDTKHDFIFSFELSYLNANAIKKNDKIPAISAIPIGNMHFDLLNEAPIVDMEVWKITTQGTGSRQYKELKIKPKQFFNKRTTAPFLNRNVYLYRLIEQFDKAQKEEQEDLQTYTKRNATPFKSSSKKKAYELIDLEEFANFPTEIDLHVEKIASNIKKRSNAEKLRLQLAHFDDYLAKAVRLGIDRVFVIHGVGEGKLRDRIAARLIQNPYVVQFKNEFHPRYGYGATEVILKE